MPVLDHVLIPTRDGTRLSARIWLPEHACADSPVPALLEYLPYRKGDWTAVRDAQRHPWYAAHGYASVRVDLRGSGDSEGVLLDEYAPAELSDGVDVIEWLAAQPWCTGKVGMFGISWGGFNSLQIAALRPPALKAIVTVCSTDDRYADDVHYFGGAVLGIDMLGWSATMLATTALPPDPERVGDWREQWEQRLDALVPFVDTWLAHQERDAYWRHGSVCEDYAAIEAPVLAVGGWADPYRNTVLRLLSGLSCPAKGIIGPWAHQYPDIDRPPGPRIGFLQETLRWWDRWLRDMPNGVECRAGAARLDAGLGAARDRVPDAARPLGDRAVVAVAAGVRRAVPARPAGGRPAGVGHRAGTAAHRRRRGAILPLREPGGPAARPAGRGRPVGALLLRRRSTSRSRSSGTRGRGCTCAPDPTAT